MATKALKRVLLLCTLLLMALAASASAAAENKYETFEVVESATLSAALSGCGLCQQTGQCDQAFRGTPGQFCQTLVSAAPCCCPVDSQCVLDNAYDCRCRRTVAYTSPNVRSGGTMTTSSSGSTLQTVLFVLLIFCCVCCCINNSRQRRQEPVRYAQPVYATSYGTNDQYAYPSAPPMYEQREYNNNNNSSGYMAAGAGAVAGLATGAFLGSAFGGDGGSRNETTSYFAGDSGGGMSTVDFSGDTGGDSGGDFAGDS